MQDRDFEIKAINHANQHGDPRCEGDVMDEESAPKDEPFPGSYAFQAVGVCTKCGSPFLMPTIPPGANLGHINWGMFWKQYPFQKCNCFVAKKEEVVPDYVLKDSKEVDAFLNNEKSYNDTVLVVVPAGVLRRLRIPPDRPGKM